MTSLLDSLEVGDVELKNRIVMPPMARGLSSFEGEPSEELIEHYSERAGNLGLLIVEHSYVSESGKFSSRQLGSHSDHLIPMLGRIAEEVKSQDTPVILQLNHAGGKSKKKVIGQTPVAPSSNYFKEKVRELEKDEIKGIKKDFISAAERAMEAGFDGVEVHGAHGFLLNQFLSPITNSRGDKYGGSFEERSRFPKEIVEGVRKIVDEGILLYRLGAVDREEGGLDLHETTNFAGILENLGVDIIDVSGGLCGSRPDDLQDEQGYFVPLAESIGSEVDVPVIGVGGITDPIYADEIVREGRVDLVAVGRAMLKNPQWAKKAVRRLS